MRPMLLSEMLAELRNEARISSDVAHGSHLTNRHVSLLRRVQEEVFHEYDWPNLQIHADVTVNPGQRYVAIPTDLVALETIRSIYARAADSRWTGPLSYGIGPAEMNEADSDAGETRENVLKWEHYLSPLAEQVHQNMIEIWPVPNREITLRIEGKRALFPLADPNTDRSTVDGMVVVLHAAAEILAGQQATDAGLKLEKAKKRYDQLRLRASATDTKRAVFGHGVRDTGQRLPRGPFRTS